MTEALFTIGLILVFVISNYVAFGYGLRIGKAMQKEIPPPPIAEPVKKVAEKVEEIAGKAAEGVAKKKRRENEEEEEEDLGLFN